VDGAGEEAGEFGEGEEGPHDPLVALQVCLHLKRHKRNKDDFDDNKELRL
jgi:hypothetical protein